MNTRIIGWFWLAFTLLVLAMVISQKCEAQPLVTADMELKSIDFIMDGDNPVGVILTYFKDGQFDKAIVYDADTKFKGYYFIDDGELYFKDNKGKVKKVERKGDGKKVRNYG